MTIIENYTEGRERLPKRGLFKKTWPPSPPREVRTSRSCVPPIPPPRTLCPTLLPPTPPPAGLEPRPPPHSAVSRTPDERPGAWRWAWDAAPDAREEWGAGGLRAGGRAGQCGPGLPARGPEQQPSKQPLAGCLLPPLHFRLSVGGNKPQSRLHPPPHP